MSSVLLQGLVKVESAPVTLPSEPERVVRRSYPGAPTRDSIELERLSRPMTSPASGPNSGANSGLNSVTPSAVNTPREELPQFDIEMIADSPSANDRGEGTDALQTIWEPYMNRFRFAASCLLNFGNGMNDAAPGALIPYMETHYDIGYAVVSLIFVGNAMGFILAAPFIDSLRERLGRGKILALAQLLMTAGYIPMVCSAPFPVLVVCFFLIGFGTALNLSMSNVFCGSLANSTTALGALHGSYGLGGTIGPLIATSIVTRPGSIWSRYYFLTLGLAVFNAAFSCWAFMGYEKDESRINSRLVQGPRGQPALAATSGRAQNNHSGAFSAFSSRVVLLGAFFIFAYQGAEVSISGWVISFLISARNGDPAKVGYVTAGFWAGITLGRFLLSGPAHRIGEKKFVYGVVVGAAIFELLVWLVPNVIGDAVSVAIVGLLLGPVYPCAAAVFMRNMSKSEQVSGLSVISAFGSSGGAAAPFSTGLLAQVAGTFVLHPIAIGLFGGMMVCWYGLPSTEKRDD